MKNKKPMESKKTTSADLSGKSWFFFNIGLAVTLAIVLMAFEYNNSDNSGDKDLDRTTNLFDDEIEIPPVDIPPPLPPPVKQPEIIVIKNDENIDEEIKFDFDVEVKEDARVEEIVVTPIEVQPEDFNAVFITAEEETEPYGGITAFYKFLSQNLKYPAQAKRMGIEGKVFVKFIVDRDGTLTNIEVMRGIGYGLEEEAVRVLKMAPKWKPAKQRGRFVRQQKALPVYFQLQ